MRGTSTLILIDRAGCIRFHEFGRTDDLQVGILLGRLLSEAWSAQANAPQAGQGDSDGGGCDDEGYKVRR